jgi:hypothetical protein
VKYLYNGVELPVLPEWDKKTYPYATIDSVATMTQITVTLTFRKSWRQDVQMASSNQPTDAIWRQPGDILYQLTKSGYNPTIGSITATDWGEGVEVTEAEWSKATSVRWSNTDIVSQGSISHDAGELILAASNPIDAETGEEIDVRPVPVTETDHNARIMGWIVGKRLAAQRGRA